MRIDGHLGLQGDVTKEEKYRSRFLLFSPSSFEENSVDNLEEFSSTGRAQRSNNRRLLGKYEIVIKNGYLHYYKKLLAEEKASMGGKLWWAYIEVAGEILGSIIKPM